jgi:hypothetical protein
MFALNRKWVPRVGACGRRWRNVRDEQQPYPVHVAAARLSKAQRDQLIGATPGWANSVCEAVLSVDHSEAFVACQELSSPLSAALDQAGQALPRMAPGGTATVGAL